MDGTATIANKSWPAISLWYPQRHFATALCTEIQDRLPFIEISSIHCHVGKYLRRQASKNSIELLFTIFYAI